MKPWRKQNHLYPQYVLFLQVVKKLLFPSLLFTPSPAQHYTISGTKFLGSGCCGFLHLQLTPVLLDACSEDTQQSAVVTCSSKR